MRHFVQYHNSETRGPYEPGPGSSGISTNKPVDHLLGDRIWLVTRYGNPPRYSLCETFVVKEVGRRRTGPQRNEAWGDKDSTFDEPVPVDSAPWFATLLRKTGNFAFGLQHIKDRRIINGLIQVAAGTRPSGPTLRQSAGRGAGFGDSAANRLVERAAIRAVTRHYKSRGWTVESREKQNLGFDLLCTKRSLEHHVEAKGVRGSICSFMITANEKQAAEADPAFRLIAVTNALDAKTRKIVTLTGEKLLREFDFAPISFIVKPRR